MPKNILFYQKTNWKRWKIYHFFIDKAWMSIKYDNCHLFFLIDRLLFWACN